MIELDVESVDPNVSQNRWERTARAFSRTRRIEDHDED